MGHRCEQNDLKIRFSNLVERQSDRLEAVCRQFFPWDEYHQRELIQYILLRLWDYMQEHSNEDEQQWEQWCPNIARQVACNYLKTHEYNQGIRMVLLDDNLKGILSDIDDGSAEELERTQKILQKLSADDYLLVQLYTSGIPHTQIAKEIGISLRKLQYKIRNVKQQLKKLSVEQ